MSKSPVAPEFFDRILGSFGPFCVAWYFVRLLVLEADYCDLDCASGGQSERRVGH